MTTMRAREATIQATVFGIRYDERIRPMPILRRVIIIKMLLLAAGATYSFESRKRPTEGSP